MKFSNSDCCIQKNSLKALGICYVWNFIGKKIYSYFVFFWKIPFLFFLSLYFPLFWEANFFWTFLIVSSERKFYKLSNGIIKEAQRLLVTFLSAKNVGWNAIQKMQRRQIMQKNYNFITIFYFLWWELSFPNIVVIFP